jgi:hypothetical protein
MRRVELRAWVVHGTANDAVWYVDGRVLGGGTPKQVSLGEGHHSIECRGLVEHLLGLPGNYHVATVTVHPLDAVQTQYRVDDSEGQRLTRWTDGLRTFLRAPAASLQWTANVRRSSWRVDKQRAPWCDFVREHAAGGGLRISCPPYVPGMSFYPLPLVTVGVYCAPSLELGLDTRIVHNGERNPSVYQFTGGPRGQGSVEFGVGARAGSDQIVMAEARGGGSADFSAYTARVHSQGRTYGQFRWSVGRVDAVVALRVRWQGQAMPTRCYRCRLCQGMQARGSQPVDDV